ncbi:MAG: type II toxin-antitoxin system VapC family toxin [Gemmatimonadetes bacterium]|nr:type II toxin-antitoxin system VapC family toxin [Gemmatimonadota bacterium]
MRFWDSSALVSLCVEETFTPRAEAHYHEDPRLGVWWVSPIECAAAFARMRREGTIQLPEEEDARAVLSALSDRWYEVQPAETVRLNALRLLRLHALSTGDALQLAAAMTWAGTPAQGELVTFDARLADAARLEGFKVLL